MRKHFFNLLLIFLSLFDLTFIVSSVPVHAIPAAKIDTISRFTKSSRMFGFLYEYFFYPFTTVSYTGSVYMTVAITIER